MKKGVLIILSLVLVLSLFSCSDIYEEVIISNPKEYGRIWSLPERRVNETSLLFPDSLNNEQCIEFMCKHTTYQLLGTGWQILLRMKYDDDMFALEVYRLRNLCTNSPVCGNSKYFENTTYASAWNWHGCFEYAIIDEEEKTISYIYLQLIEEKNLCVEKEYIPIGYEIQMTDCGHYSIY